MQPLLDQDVGHAREPRGSDRLARPSSGAAEGEPPNSTVVLRFADASAAWGFLRDPEYQPLKAIRLSVTSRGQMVVSPDFVPPK